jgi:hypothetical protein
MKPKRVIRVIVFWLFLGVLLSCFELGVKLGVRNSTYAQYAKVNIIADHKAKPQIAIFGSSVGEVGVNARMINDSLHTPAYNFSIDGTRFQQYKGLINELNEYDDSCKLVIFAEAFFALSPVNQLTEVDRYIAHVDNDNIYQSLYTIQPGLVWKLRHIPFYTFVAINHTYFKASVEGLTNLKNRNQFYDPYLGYTPRNITWQADMDSLNKQGKLLEVVVDSNILKGYTEVVHSIQKKGRKVLIIIPPIFKDGLQLIHNLDLQRAAFKSLEGNGVSFIDYSNCVLSNDKKYFYNNTHLNNVGADAFTQILLGDVQKIIAGLPVPVWH